MSELSRDDVVDVLGPRVSDALAAEIIATGITSGEAGREADEFMIVETMTLTRALELINKGEIRDAKTALVILYAAGFRAGH